MNEAWQILGKPQRGGILAVCDHASNHVPDDIALDIDARLMGQHIAWDIGVAGVARYLVDISECAAFLAVHSRLVVDLNRYPGDAGIIPVFSDGVEITGNHLGSAERADRLDRYFHPYHQRLDQLIREQAPALILSIHSFTPRLETDPLAERPWDIGILYNLHEAAAMLAISYLEGENLIVGDQLPYSGKQLNATMNRHAEAHDIPYVGIEIRQDLIESEAGQERYAAILADMAQYIAEKLASEVAS